MRKKAIALAFFLMLYIFAYPQQDKRGVFITAKGGATFANMYGDVSNQTFLVGFNNHYYANSPASSVFKSGFGAGVAIEYRMGKNFGLGFGGSYVPKGAKINVERQWNSEEMEYQTLSSRVYWVQNYANIEIPLTFYIPIGLHEVYLQAGGFMAYLINSTEKGTIKTSTSSFSYTNDRGANSKEFGFVLSAGYLYPLPNTRGSVLMEVQWTRSLLNSYGDDMIPNPEYYFNQTISLNVGYRYRLTR